MADAARCTGLPPVAARVRDRSGDDPPQGIEYGHQEVASVFIGAALDIGVSLAVGASMGPPGALIGALAGVAFAALDVWTVIRLGQL